MQPDEEIERECNSLRIPNGTYYKYIWILVLGRLLFSIGILEKISTCEDKSALYFSVFLVEKLDGITIC